MSQYLRFDRDTSRPDLKTEVWTVSAERDGSLLGRIKWFGRWRQYAFFPEQGTVFNPDCMDSINGVIRSLMRRRQRGRVND